MQSESLEGDKRRGHDRDCCQSHARIPLVFTNELRSLWPLVADGGQTVPLRNAGKTLTAASTGSAVRAKTLIGSLWRQPKAI